MKRANPVDLVTQSEFARRMDVSRQVVSRAVKSGRIALHGQTSKLDWLTQEKAWYDNAFMQTRAEEQRKQREKRAQGDGEPDESVSEDDENSYSYWRAKREKEEFLKKRRENEEAQKILIPRHVINMVLFPFVRAVREAILSIPDRCGASIAADIRGLIPDTVHLDQDSMIRVTHMALESELRNILNEVSQVEHWDKEIPQSEQS